MKTRTEIPFEELREKTSEKMRVGSALAEGCEVVVSTDVLGKRPGDVYILRWGPKQRLLRAVFSGSASLVIGLALLVFTRIHGDYILAFLVAGAAMSYFNFNRKSLVVTGVLQCPKCDAVSEFSNKPDRWPIFESCSVCASKLIVRKQNS